MDSLPFFGRDLDVGQALVRVITFRPFPDATAIAVVSQGDGSHLVAVRSIRGKRQRNVVFTDLDDALVEQVVGDLIDQVLDGGTETIETTEGAESSTSVLEALAFAMGKSPAPRRVTTISGLGLPPRRGVWS